MAFIHRVLEPPSYGWQARPDASALFGELARRVNLFATRKNWLPFSNWFWTLALLPFTIVWMVEFFSFSFLAVGFLYSMVWMGSHGTLWLHRFGTHRAFVIRNRVFRFILRNLTIKVVPEEIYIVSHHVHHALSDKPGDPYNVNNGGLYCYLADTNHQPIHRDLSREDYARVVALVEHTGVVPNSYEQYQRWGSITHPLRMSLLFAGNWAFWYAAFFLLGGHALAVGLFGSAFFWAVGIRTFNFAGHGSGADRRREGSDFNRRDLSVNQLWPGLVAGEWHNNHHLFSGSARTGYQWYQIDLPWYLIRALRAVGVVTSYRDFKTDFVAKHLRPYRDRRRGQGSERGPAPDGAGAAGAPGGAS